MKNKKFERLLLKNTLAITIPAIAVFLLLIFMFMRYPIFDQIRCNDIGSIDHVPEKLAELYQADTTNVKYTAKDLYYTGFDYYVNGEIEGAYYYTMNQGNMLMFLIRTDDPQIEIDSITVKGKIIRDVVSTEHILNRLSSKNGIDLKRLQDYCCEYMISEPDYPLAFISMVYVFFYSPVVICVLVFIYTLLVWINPLLHSQSRQLAAYGDPGAIIEELDIQLTKRLLFKKNNIYITADYMIVSYLTRTDVIRLDYIKYLSKNLVEDGKHRNGPVYRLTMSNPDKMFYEVDFTSEELIDIVAAYIRGINDTDDLEVPEKRLDT